VLSKELGQTPGKKEPIHDSKKYGETDFATSPPLTMLAKRPVWMDERRIIRFILERLMLVAISMEIDEEPSLVPLCSTFDSSELPFPECRLGCKPTKHNGHLHGHQHSKQTKYDDKECKNPCESLPGEQKANGPDKD